MWPSKLKILGVVAFFGSAPPNNQGAAIVKKVSRIGLFFGLPLIMTIVTGHLTAEAIDTSKAKEHIWRMASRQLVAASEELGHSIYVTKWASVDMRSIAIGVGIDTPLAEPNSDPCKRSLTFSEVDTAPQFLCLFFVRRIASVFPLPAWIGGPFQLPELISPFRIVEFPATSYAIADVVIETAVFNGIDLSNRKANKVRFLVEKELGGQGADLFLPDSEQIVWARRLNGHIQFFTYFAFFYALVLILMRYLEFVWPNTAIRQIREVTLTDADLKSVVRFSNECKADEGAESTDSGEVVAVDAELQTRPTPWSKTIHFRNYHETNNYYIALSDHIRGACSFFGCRIDAPILRFRRAAANAVENTRDTSIVPVFLDAQRQSIVSLNDALTNQIRFLIWAIPTVGFIGTVIGISEALTSTVPLQSTSDFIAASAQGRVSSLMGMAFDTTLIALVASFIVMLLFHLLQEAEESMVIRERDEAEEEVMRNVRVIDDENQSPEAIVGAITSMEDTIPALAQAVNNLQPTLNRVFEIAQRMHSLQLNVLRQVKSTPENDMTNDRKRGKTAFIILLIFLFAFVLAKLSGDWNGLNSYLERIIGSDK